MDLAYCAHGICRIVLLCCPSWKERARWVFQIGVRIVSRSRVWRLAWKWCDHCVLHSKFVGGLLLNHDFGALCAWFGLHCVTLLSMMKIMCPLSFASGALVWKGASKKKRRRIWKNGLHVSTVCTGSEWTRLSQLSPCHIGRKAKTWVLRRCVLWHVQHTPVGIVRRPVPLPIEATLSAGILDIDCNNHITCRASRPRATQNHPRAR